MTELILILGLAIQIAAIAWLVCFYLVFLHPMTWRDIVGSLGVLVTALAVGAISTFVKVKPAPLLFLVILGVCLWTQLKSGCHHVRMRHPRGEGR
jgi:hypothetical protein